MRQIFRTFLIDVRMSMKSFMGGYMIIVPVIILIVLRSFIPSVESTAVTIAVVAEGSHAVEQGLIDKLDGFANVISYDSIEKMEQKLRGTGSAEGLYWDPASGQYVSVVERTRESNTIFSVGARVARQYTYETTVPGAPRITNYSYGVPPELADRTKTSPVATVGGAIFMVFMTIISGFLIGLNIVNDKEEGTDAAIKVSPVSKFDYFVGKSIFPFLISLAYAIIALGALRLLGVSIAMTYSVVIISFSATLLLGLFLGALAKNENEAIGLGKMGSMIVSLSILGGTLLPDGWQWAVWWSPFYWIYDILEEVFSEAATWAALGWKSALVVGITAVFYLILRKKIVKGLS